MQCKKRRAAFTCLLLFASGPLLASNADWQSLSLQDGAFTIKLPGKPTLNTENDQSLVGEVKTDIYSVDIGQTSVAVTQTFMPEAAVVFADPNILYDNAKGALLKRQFGKVDSFNSVTTDRVEGKMLTYSTPPATGHPGMRGQAGFFLIGHSLFIVDVMWPANLDGDLSEKVFQSLKLQPK